MLKYGQMTDLGQKNRPNLGQIISRTICDRDKTICFCRKRGSIRSSWAYKGTQWDRKMSKTRINRAEVPHHVQVWGCPPPPLGTQSAHTNVIQKQSLIHDIRQIYEFVLSQSLLCISSVSCNYRN